MGKKFLTLCVMCEQGWFFKALNLDPYPKCWNWYTTSLSSGMSPEQAAASLIQKNFHIQPVNIISLDSSINRPTTPLQQTTQSSLGDEWNEWQTTHLVVQIQFPAQKEPSSQCLNNLFGELFPFSYFPVPSCIPTVQILKKHPLSLLENASPLEISYVNYKNELGIRAIVPKKIFFGSNEWHSQPQWLLEALDLTKKKLRFFAMADIRLTRTQNRLLCHKCKKVWSDPHPEVQRRQDNPLAIDQCCWDTAHFSRLPLPG